MKERRRITIEEEIQFVDMFNLGISINQISKKTGRSGTTITRKLREMGHDTSIHIQPPIKIYRIDSNDKVFQYNSVADASRITGVAASSISNCINGKRKTAGGCIWKKRIGGRYNK